MNILIGLLLIIAPVRHDAISSVLSDSLQIKIDMLLAAYDDLGKPGLTLGIIDNGKLVFEKGYGMAIIDRQLANSPKMAYKVASVSKQFTAAAILDLVRKGDVSLTDKLYKYIPELPSYARDITLSDLLYHTSGIRDYMVLMWLSGISFEDDFANLDALQLILKQRELNFPPGTRCVYSNSNYVLLAEVVERRTGASLAEYAGKNLFDPLGMHDTGFGTTGIETGLALSYTAMDSGYMAYRNENQVVGDGGLFTTLGDLAKWDAAFYRMSSLNHELLTPGRLANGNPLYYGMGIIMGQYRGEPVYMHPGAFLGYRAELLRFPGKKVSIVCLGNSDEINPEMIARQVADIYVFDENPVEKTPIPDYDLESITELEGRYEVVTNVFITITFEKNLLMGQVTGQPKHILYPVDKWKYRIGDTGDEVSFERDSLSAVRQLIVLQQQANTVAKKLGLVEKGLAEYCGEFYNPEQGVTYHLEMHGGKLWFKVGTNPGTQIDVVKKYDRAYFGYKNLEQATMDFIKNDKGEVIGFELNSGRVFGLRFTRRG